MGKLLPSYKKAVVDEIINGITTESSSYYAFAANPILNDNDEPAQFNASDYSTNFTNGWQMIFGKKLSNNDIRHIVTNNIWQTNTVYDRYDNTKDMTDLKYYVISNEAAGSNYNVFKCIDNGNNSPSLKAPSIVQPSSFTEVDGYIWRYITTISSGDYIHFATPEYAPILANSTMVSSAYDHSGIEVVVVENGGAGYIVYSDGLDANELALTSVNGTFTNGDFVYQSNGTANVATGYVYGGGASTVKIRLTGPLNQFSTSYTLFNNNSISNASVTAVTKNGSNNFIRQVNANNRILQIEGYEPGVLDYYTKSSIYLYNTTSATAQLRTIVGYYTNTVGNWVLLDSGINTSYVTSGSTQYKITPRVVFDTDADSPPSAYPTINSSSNSISGVVIIDPGYGISWANVSIETNYSYGSGASLYAIIPPAGGHGSDPASELQISGFAITIDFANNESNTITTNTYYNKIGLIKNPYSLETNGSKGSLYTTSTFSQILEGSVLPTVSFEQGTTVIGNTSGALGTVVYSDVITSTYNFTSTAGQTIFLGSDNNSNTLSYNPDNVIVTVDTVELTKVTDFIATNGTSITLTSPLAAGKSVVISSISAPLHLTGDKSFVDGEYIVGGSNTAVLSINTLGALYTKDLRPLYVQNINNVTRTKQQTESFKLIVQV